jgi:quercetin dioxygenase-like cupin family protein
VRSWDINTLDVKAHSPRIVSSTDDARAIVIVLEAGEQMADHVVHERAWIVVTEGEIEITPDEGSAVAGRPGALFALEPRERHAVLARSDSRLLLLLTPWPGEGHPGAMSLESKATAVRDAAARASR